MISTLYHEIMKTIIHNNIRTKKIKGNISKKDHISSPQKVSPKKQTYQLYKSIEILHIHFIFYGSSISKTLIALFYEQDIIIGWGKVQSGKWEERLESFNFWNHLM